MFSTLIFFNLFFMVTREFLSPFDSYLRFTNLPSIASASPAPISTTSTSILLASSQATSFRPLHSALFRSPIFSHKRLNHGGSYKLEIPVKYRLYDQEKIVQWLNKKLEKVKKSYNVKFLNLT